MPKRTTSKAGGGTGPDADPAGEGTEAWASTGGPGRAGPWQARDVLIPFVLLAVSMQRAHGYLIEEYLRALGFLGVGMSTLYRTLRQLEREGLLVSAWEPGPGGPARRVYTLTDAGRTWLDASATGLEAYRAMIDRFFGLYTGRRSTADDAKESTR